jgi:glycosyltransferase involved in cell wall biosynthesis
MDFARIAGSSAANPREIPARTPVMRVAFLTHEPFFPPSGGGSAEAVYLVEEMVQRGHEVHVFCPKLVQPEEIRAKFAIHLHQFTTFEMGRYTSFRNLKYLLYPSLLQKLVERVHAQARFDMVVSQHAIAAVTAGRLKRKLGIPVVQNFLDYLTGFMETWPPYLAPPPALAVLKRFELSMPKRYGVNGIMTVSDTLADYFASSGYPREKILPIYYGYDSKLFLFRDSPKAPTPPVIVMHGSLDHHHLGPIALDAVEIVSRQMPNALFKFVGHETAALKSFVQKVKSIAPNARTETTGFVAYSQVAAHLQSADLGIVPYEASTGTHCAFVAKIVEYLAIGLPVVSTKLNSAFRYFNHESRVTFTEFNAAAFAKAIIDRLQTPDDPAQALAASERVRKKLDWRAISRKAIDFVEAARETKRPG